MRAFLIFLTIMSAVLFCFGLRAFATQDVTAPVLTGFSLTQTDINTSAADQTVTANFTLTDDLTGFYTGEIMLYNLNSSQHVRIIFGLFQLVSGTALNGTYQVPLKWLKYSAIGTWQVDHISLTDMVGNQINFSRLPTGAPLVYHANPAFAGYSAVHTF